MLAYRIAEVFDTTIEELCCLKENKELEDQKMHKINPGILLMGHWELF